jgi:transketolase
MITKIANTIRGLAADMVEKAKSGHPGMPLGTAELGAVLFTEFLKHDPADPAWPDRDRFVLSAGHGSAFLYSLLHLTGYNLPLEELKRFRQLDSKTPGHPEYGVTPGVETTTGPLGQGIGNAVGMALAERMMAARFNRPGLEIVNHFTYVLAGDGCMMEGISSEASSLAGFLGLGKLIMIYDDNQISIEGSTDLAFNEDVGQRYQAYGWQVLEIDGHDPARIQNALARAKAETGSPTLIIAKTSIAKGSPLEGNSETHGAPLGKENVAILKRNINLPDQEFYIPEEVTGFYAGKHFEWQKTHQEWTEKFQAWSEQFPDLRREWERIIKKELPQELEEVLPRFQTGATVATRDASGAVLNNLAARLPELIGGSADLAPSTKTYIKGSPDIATGNFDGRNLHFGVREHAMGAILNGISLYGGFRVFGSTFLVFSDYMRPPIRLAALMEQPVIFVFTHDSFWVGEDGPTHQPVEHIEALRLIPNLWVLRPADANETAWAWLFALRANKPSALILTRQKLPVLIGTSATGFEHGGYVIQEPETGRPDVVIIASGSEVPLALETAALISQEGKQARVVSMPCRELFWKQTPEYRARIIGANIPLVIIEAGTGMGWRRFVSGPEESLIISLERFGQSAPAEQLTKVFGFTPESVLQKMKAKFKW